jgi:CBS domain-containing protein
VLNLVDLMTTDVLVVSPETSLAETARRMVQRDTGAAVVLREGSLLGVISERDLLRSVSEGLEVDTPVSERMTTHVLTAGSQTTLAEAMAMMVDGHFRHLPVVDHGNVIGMISMRDLMAWASLHLRGGRYEEDDGVDTAELLATIHRMRTGAA